ncbi:hypothetical protein [Halalkalirubrum salinum]|uniref:hypothetical protein n=1 Tax=Halalkalirubrum salinum TaxID=2563889 RepID=UPI0010FAF1DF|nr:hypothetical protein [Halalkalirubrum salinum]
MTDNTQTIEIDIPTELQTKLEARIDGTDFESVEAYLQFILEVILVADETSAERQTEQTNTNADLEARLEDLGYL